MRGCLVLCRMFGSIPGLYPSDVSEVSTAVTTKMFPNITLGGGVRSPRLRTIGLTLPKKFNQQIFIDHVVWAMYIDVKKIDKSRRRLCVHGAFSLVGETAVNLTLNTNYE